MDFWDFSIAISYLNKFIRQDLQDEEGIKLGIEKAYINIDVDLIWNSL